MRRLLVLGLFAAAAWTGCGGGAGGTSTPVASATATASSSGQSLESEYAAAGWQNGASVSFSGSCSMTLTTTGAPAYHNEYYLAPTGSGAVVAHTAESNTALYLIQYSGSNFDAVTQTLNICPSKAAKTTATSGGPIGYMITGEPLFDPYEMSGTQAALADNGSYAVPGTGQTAYFIDTCNSHSTMAMNGTAEWHFHGVPTCLTSQVDGASGPSHIIGIALDGFPIYGGRDINGNVISTSQLDACNGITSATPEFPNGIYHYVLPIGVTSSQSSIGCYAGTVSTQVAEQAARNICGLDALAAHRLAQRDAARRRRRPVSS